jgi:hypothetical protein
MHFLGRVHKIVKSDYLLPYVSLRIRVEQRVSGWADFHDILYLNVFFYISSDSSFIDL